MAITNRANIKRDGLIYHEYFRRPSTTGLFG